VTLGPRKLAERRAYFERRALEVDDAAERRRLRSEAERAAAELAARKACRCCGRHLEDPDSQRRGYGPDCAAKHGLPL
jgi:hypothetical protein